MQKESTRLANWPSPQDYNEAIQNLWVNSHDPELRNAMVQLNSVGLPMPRTGAFASVYRVSAAGKDLAVRCFLRDIRDQKQRYAEISRFVQSDSLPYTVGFDFIRKGIQVNGQWTPVLKMDWVDGLNLDHYIETHLGTERIASLAKSFLTMCQELREAGIAHGDLQHGNILICDGELRLVDYDGMYVPSMKGLESNEIGHRNYQHPMRDATHFGPYLDNFSAWVIYASLRALLIDKTLYQALSGGDDCLLFRRDDFAEPEHSYAFSLLERHENKEIRALSNFLRWLCGTRLEEVPPLTDALPVSPKLPAIKVDRNVHQPAPLPPRPANLSPSTPPSKFVANGLPDWLKPGGHVNSVSNIEPALAAPCPRNVFYEGASRPHPLVMQLLMVFSPTVWLMMWGLLDLEFSPLVLICLVMNLYMMSRIWSPPLLDRKLAINGHIAKATRVSPRMYQNNSNGVRTYYVHYEFHPGPKSGPIHIQKEINQLEYELLMDDTYHTVLYDPNYPSDNVLYCICRYRAI